MRPLYDEHQTLHEEWLTSPIDPKRSKSNFGDVIDTGLELWGQTWNLNARWPLLTQSFQHVAIDNIRSKMLELETPINLSLIQVVSGGSKAAT